MLLDYCYYQNCMVLYFITCDPKNKWLYKACYMNSYGVLSMATLVFGNKIIVSKIYYATSCMIHIMPAMILYVVTNIIMVEESALPEH